jgi:hypothetical protein
MLVKSEKVKTGAIYAIYLEQNWIFTGGWDKVINIQVPFIFVVLLFYTPHMFPTVCFMQNPRNLRMKYH